MGDIVPTREGQSLPAWNERTLRVDLLLSPQTDPGEMKTTAGALRTRIVVPGEIYPEAQNQNPKMANW